MDWDLSLCTLDHWSSANSLFFIFVCFLTQQTPAHQVVVVTIMSFPLTELIVNPESLPKNDLGFSHNDVLNTWAMKSTDFKAKKDLELNQVLFNKVLRSMLLFRIALCIQAPSNKECHATLHSKSVMLIDKICLYFWGFVVNHNDDFMSWGFFFLVVSLKLLHLLCIHWVRFVV